MTKDLILVTDWEKVQADDYYLTDEWGANEEQNVLLARDLQKEGKLYVGYIVEALSYAIYVEMDAGQVFIDEDMEVVLNCESKIIGNHHDRRIEYTY